MVESFIETLIITSTSNVSVDAFARELCVAKDCEYANMVFFGVDGKYIRFDDTEPISVDMGKPKVLEIIKSLKARWLQGNGHYYRSSNGCTNKAACWCIHWIGFVKGFDAFGVRVCQDQRMPLESHEVNVSCASIVAFMLVSMNHIVSRNGYDARIF